MTERDEFCCKSCHIYIRQCAKRTCRSVYRAVLSLPMSEQDYEPDGLDCLSDELPLLAFYVILPVDSSVVSVNQI